MGNIGLLKKGSGGRRCAGVALGLHVAKCSPMYRAVSARRKVRRGGEHACWEIQGRALGASSREFAIAATLFRNVGCLCADFCILGR
jgi:hypothetical protein